jgi:hypothetical protein
MSEPCPQPEVNVSRSADTGSILIEATISETFFMELNKLVVRDENRDIHSLAQNRPRDAYVWLSQVWKNRFIDPNEEDWSIGSAEDDGQQAFDGLTRYVEERTAPDPDIDEVEIIISVWKQASFMDVLRGSRHVPQEVLSFSLEPPDLAGYSA